MLRPLASGDPMIKVLFYSFSIKWVPWFEMILSGILYLWIKHSLSI